MGECWRLLYREQRMYKTGEKAMQNFLTRSRRGNTKNKKQIFPISYLILCEVIIVNLIKKYFFNFSFKIERVVADKRNWYQISTKHWSKFEFGTPYIISIDEDISGVGFSVELVGKSFENN